MDKYLNIYTPCPRCGTSGNENFYVGYDCGLGDPVPCEKGTGAGGFGSFSKLKVVCKKCKHARAAL